MNYKCTYCGFIVKEEELDKVKNARPLERIVSQCMDHFDNSHAEAMSLSDWLPIEEKNNG